MNPTKPNISPKDLKPMVCTECGGMYFRQVMRINKVSRFLTGKDKDTVYPASVFRCDDCGHVPEEFQLEVN
jgi:hypothetical protein|tara:strand:+ start:488 stop:700 length:213 start_codon:yes stop_codon:yes gene_type:complete